MGLIPLSSLATVRQSFSLSDSLILITNLDMVTILIYIFLSRDKRAEGGTQKKQQISMRSNSGDENNSERREKKS